MREAKKADEIFAEYQDKENRGEVAKILTEYYNYSRLLRFASNHDFSNVIKGVESVASFLKEDKQLERHLNEFKVVNLAEEKVKEKNK